MVRLLGDGGAQSSFFECIDLFSKPDTLSMRLCGCVKGALLLAFSFLQIFLKSLGCRFQSHIFLLAAVNGTAVLMRHRTLSARTLLVQLNQLHSDGLWRNSMFFYQTCTHTYSSTCMRVRASKAVLANINTCDVGSSAVRAV